MKNVVILGSTGSIGVNTLKVIDGLRSGFRVVGLTGKTNVGLLSRQIKKYRPEIAITGAAQDAAELSGKFRRQKIRILSGPEGLVKAATWPKADLVVSALVGSFGLEPTLAAIRSGKDIALANKEVLVMAGSLMISAAKRHGVSILPVDSEHSAIWQCLKNEPKRSISRIILTASGGPFWRLSAAELKKVTLDRTLAHPTWNMGKKVTIDSATLMNKGFEVIEAHYLFGLPLDRIDVVIHPESIVHSLVEFTDGSVLAQLATADMRLPIQYALCYPERKPNNIARLDLARTGELTFCKPDLDKFPCLQYAYRAAAIGGTMPAVMSASDEIAVQSFLSGGIAFLQISEVIAAVMKRHQPDRKAGIAGILKAAEWARDTAKKLIGRMT
jgi:1-deoxy-D-xylulose-5-phosphate reductoisomerase